MTSLNESFGGNGSGWTTTFESTEPQLTSERCSHALAQLFEKRAELSVAVEASSHPSGLDSLLAQPWLYAGGGLGNMDECPFQVCLAGAGFRRDSVTFASVCIVPQCSAEDLGAGDFSAVATRVSSEATESPLVHEYITLLRRIKVINKFLGTGWTCGDFEIPWSFGPFGQIFLLFSICCLVLFLAGTSFYSQRMRFNWVLCACETFDGRRHVSKLLRRHSSRTAILDGLRVFSLFWIILGHTMAIMSTSGAGYENPANFLPPEGLTTTWGGQLLFSSRFAVDTFLCISGFLLVHILQDKLPTNNSLSSIYLIPRLILGRVARVLPVYAFSLGFYTQIAPHLGSGPFWYQWLGLLVSAQSFFIILQPKNSLKTTLGEETLRRLCVDERIFYQQLRAMGRSVDGDVFLPFLVSCR